jgi:hypothetical protein
VAGAGLAAVVLVGCSAGSSTPSTTSSPPGATSTVATPGSTAGSTSTTVDVPPYNAAHNAFPDVTTRACTGSAGTGWVLSGTVHNRASTTRSYSLAVDFITTPGDTVIATRLVDVRAVAPGTSKTWTTGPAAAQSHAALSCVVRQALWR